RCIARRADEPDDVALRELHALREPVTEAVEVRVVEHPTARGVGGVDREPAGAGAAQAVYLPVGDGDDGSSARREEVDRAMRSTAARRAERIGHARGRD